MKKTTLFIIIGLFFSLRVLAQAPKSDVVNAAMPPEAKKLTKEQLAGFVHQNYKVSQIPKQRENTYQLDGLLISFWDISVNPEFKKSLEASQSEILEYLRSNSANTVNYSKIVTVNNIQFLVYEYQQQDEVYLWFDSDYNKNNKRIVGVIQFKEPDKDKAHTALNDFLQTVHFKN